MASRNECYQADYLQSALLDPGGRLSDGHISRKLVDISRSARGGAVAVAARAATGVVAVALEVQGPTTCFGQLEQGRWRTLGNPSVLRDKAKIYDVYTLWPNLEHSKISTLCQVMAV